jgi:uncharacterized protein (DUF362 family)
VLDGFTAMEGNGPVSGNKVDWGVAIAGTDGVAVDSVAAHLMGFDPKSIGYLNFCSQDGLGRGNMDTIRVIGSTVEECRHPFKPHQSYEAQLIWQQEGEAAFRKLKEHLDKEDFPKAVPPARFEVSPS